MGNQESAVGTEGTVSYFSFYNNKAKRHLGIRWDRFVNVQTWAKHQCFSLFEAAPFGEEAGQLGPDWEGLVSRGDQRTLVSLRVLGGNDDAEGRYLAVTSNGNVQGGDEPTPWILEEVSHDEDGSRQVRLRAHNAMDSAPAQYLHPEDGGLVRLKGVANTDCLFQLTVATLPQKKVKNARKIAKGVANLIKLPGEPDLPPANVTEEDIEHYKREGYVICKGLLTEEQVAVAKEKIQQGVDEGADKSKGFLGIAKGAQRWTKAYKTAPEVLGLMTASPAMQNCEALSGNVCTLPKEAQIALRRKTEDGSKDFAVGLDWHIDAYDKVTAARFGVLVVMALSDWDEDNMGNFTAYPGSHLQVAEMMKEMSWLEWQKTQLNSKPLGIEPRQMHVKTGDVIFAHPLLAHDVAVNTTDRVRWAVIFRTGFVKQREHRDELLNPESPSASP